jgi:prophage regulatory protein
MGTTQTPVAEPARLLDVQAVAGLLGVSGRHVYRLADGGKMPRPLKLGGAVRWDRDVIRRWIDSGCPSVVQAKGGSR